MTKTKKMQDFNKPEPKTHIITQEMVNGGNRHFTSFIDSGVKIEGDINNLKRYVDTVSEAVSDGGMGLPNYITDMFYGVEVEYQRFYDLDQDNFDTVKVGDVVLTATEDV